MATKIFKTFTDKEGVEKKYLAMSYSQLDTFLTCPRQWGYRYLKGLGKNDDTESTQLGTQVHASIEEYCNKLSEGYEWTIAEAVKLVATNLEKRTIRFDGIMDCELVETHKQMMESLVTGDGELARLLTRCDVLSQELEFRIPIKLPFTVKYGNEEYNEVMLNGFIDLILKDKKSDDIIVVDHKTSKSVFKPYKLKNNLQLPIYSLVIKSVYGRLPSECYYYFTRFDTLQSVQCLAINDECAEKVFFKSGTKKGQLKSKQKTVSDVENELISIFKRMYQPINGYETKNSPLCSWCNFGHYGDLRCEDAQFYKRTDKEVPKENTVTI